MIKKRSLASIPEIIKDIKAGKMIILVDDESRENEGDLVIPASKATAEKINFMAKFGRGLICLALTSKRVKELDLPLMSSQNASRHQTAFTVSIEARTGVTTGISASDRARTIKTAINPRSSKRDIVSPGHVFPLVARDGGVLVRAGHTEAAVDIANLAGTNPSAVICEIMNDDGTMARFPDLLAFSRRHKIKLATISDLISHRRQNEKIIKRMMETKINSIYGGEFRMIVYINQAEYAEHIALVKGNISKKEPTFVRVHSLNVLDDVLGSKSSGRGGELSKAMHMIQKKGKGIVILIREPRPTSLLDRMKMKSFKNKESFSALRDYGVGAQILLDLGVKEMILLSNTTRNIVGLDGYGLKVVGRRSL